MPLSCFCELVKSALPEDVRPDELLSCAPRGIWENNPYEATVIALRDCPRLNWDAYLLRNPDVKASGMEPHWHYVKHGIYEGRRLISWHGLKGSENPGAPLVSLILINYNNAHFLGKCLDSVISQTIRDMEIIIVDDCSTDESMEIIEEYKTRDQRIKVLVNEQNSASLIARKRGVLAATGRYLMFLDSDDYLENDACETALTAIAGGYDIVKFGVHLTNVGNAPEQEAKNCDIWCNKGESREYVYDEILSSFFVEFKLSWLLWSSIYLRELVVVAFNDLPDAYFTGADDALAVLAISHRARNMLKISGKLVHYNYGLGISVSGEPGTYFKYLLARCDAARYFNEYIHKHALSVDGEKLYSVFCEPIIDKFIYVAREREAATGLALLAETLGKKYVLKYLINHYANNLPKLGIFLKPLDNIPAKIKHLGIYCPDLRQPGIMIIIRSLYDLCASSQYQLTIFTEQKLPKGKMALPGCAHIIRFANPDPGSDNLADSTDDFAEAVADGGVDAILHLGAWRPHLIWYTLLMHWLRVPVIFVRHYNSTLVAGAGFDPKPHIQDVIFHGADAVVCASRAEELYWRGRGVNAIWIPTPVRQTPPIYRKTLPATIAVVCGPDTDEGHVHQALLVLQEIVRRAPWMSLMLMISHESPGQRQKYEGWIKDLCLEKHTRIGAWTDDPTYILKQCGVFLSVASGGSVPFGMLEAQAAGIPCVIYDMAIIQAGDNPSIIQIPRGDYCEAAQAILDLFADAEQWHRLSAMAVERSKKHAPEIFVENMRNLLDKLPLSMPIRKYEDYDYVDLVNMVPFFN